MKSHFPSITPLEAIEHRSTKINTAAIKGTEIDGVNIDKLNEIIQTFKNKLDELVGWYYNFLTHRHLITEHNGVTYEGNIGIGFRR